MLALMADVNVVGQLRRVVQFCVREPWHEYWVDLGVAVTTFAEQGLSRETRDEDIWLHCQERQILLFTGNRNAEDDDSLEAAIRRHGHAASLPVLTVSDMRRIMRDSEYAERVATKLMEVLYDLDLHRGTGRVYLP